jgi:crotonobetainyl-CoA:carnitine CoA-transferase CaiB-like acyl-CoA transferase
MDATTDDPLVGIRVIDFTMALAGPLATMLLADLGADVIKVEDASRPESLEMMRVALNRNKRSVLVDLKSPEGHDLALALVETAQVVVSSFRPGVMDSLGLGAEALMKNRPDLIWAALSGYGETGPSAHRRSMDKIVQAEGGLMSIGPMIDQVAPVDCMAGMGLANSIVAALLRRERTGHGARVSARLFDAGLLLQAPTIAAYSVDGTVTGNSVAGYPVADLFETSDGAVFIAAYYDWHWRSLCGALGLEELAEDPRFVTRELRTEPANAEILRPILRSAIADLTRNELLAALDSAGVMACAIRGYGEIFEDPQVRLNSTFIDSPYRDSSVKLVRPPFTLDNVPTPFVRPCPEVGQHTVEVLGEIGVSAAKIDKLLEAGVVQQGPTGTD